MMIAAIIYVVSVFALVQFFVYYCRSIVASSRKVALSKRVCEAAGVEGEAIAADDFRRFLGLVRLCPEGRTGNADLRVVSAYYSLLRILGAMSRAVIPGIAAWSDGERRNCSHFAAVALDRRISFNRDLFIQEAGGGS